MARESRKTVPRSKPSRKSPPTVTVPPSFCIGQEYHGEYMRRGWREPNCTRTYKKLGNVLRRVSSLIHSQATFGEILWIRIRTRPVFYPARWDNYREFDPKTGRPK